MKSLGLIVVSFLLVLPAWSGEKAQECAGISDQGRSVEKEVSVDSIPTKKVAKEDSIKGA